MGDEHTVCLDLDGQEFDFQLLHNPLDLRLVTVQQYWLDKRQLYGQRRRPTRMLATVLEFYRRYCEREGAFQDPDTCQTYLLSHLLPNARTIGAQRVLADASLLPLSRNGNWEDELPAQRLERLLSQAPLERRSELDFHEQSRAVLAPQVFTECDRSRYMVLQSELFHESVVLLHRRHDDAVLQVRQNWTRLSQQYGRRAGFVKEKQVLDVLSYEARAAYRRCYSVVWTALIQALAAQQRINRETARFLAIWHLEFVREEGADLFRLFHGHVFGLHPATALLIQTPTGRRAIGQWLVAPSNLQLFETILYATLVAIHTYAEIRDEYNAYRRGPDRRL